MSEWISVLNYLKWVMVGCAIGTALIRLALLAVLERKGWSRKAKK